MGPTWVLSAPDGPHVDPMNLAIRGVKQLAGLVENGGRSSGHANSLTRHPPRVINGPQRLRHLTSLSLKHVYMDRLLIIKAFTALCPHRVYHITGAILFYFPELYTYYQRLCRIGYCVTYSIFQDFIGIIRSLYHHVLQASLVPLCGTKSVYIWTDISGLL